VQRVRLDPASTGALEAERDVRTVVLGSLGALQVLALDALADHVRLVGIHRGQHAGDHATT